MTYPIPMVVAGFPREITEDERIPFTLARTALEYRQLRSLVREALEWTLSPAVEFGCGYGRMLPLLKEFTDEVVGLERDRALAQLAGELNPDVNVLQTPTGLQVSTFQSGYFQVALTMTVLQHMDDADCKNVLTEIQRVLRSVGTILMCEAEPKDGGPGTWGRTPEQYQTMLPEFRLVECKKRIGELGIVHGNIMVFRR